MFGNMIRGFKSGSSTEPEGHNRIQWNAALGAGLIAGLILLVVPRGSPWSSLTFFSPVIMGRTLPSNLELPLLAVWSIHLLVSLLYGFIISTAVAGLRFERAVVTGGLLGLVLYVLNLGLVSLALPVLRANEVSVAFTHVVFGLLAAGAYRGLLRRKPAPPSQHKPA
jgi:hypothetical protein